MMDPDYVARLEASSEVGYVVDAARPGEPLVISFGYVAWDEPPRFDFFGRLRKLEKVKGECFSRLFVRDPANLWYQHGVPGLGHDAPSTASTLRRLIGGLNPSSVTTIGQSMGGYGAILFGSLIEADRVIAFGPLSHLRSDWARRDGDVRWLSVMEKLDRFPPAIRYDDLCALLTESRHVPEISVLYGSRTAPGEATNFDALHAARLAKCPGVKVTEFADAPHAVVKWLVEQKLIDDVLYHSLRTSGGAIPQRSMRAGESAEVHSPTFSVLNDSWRSWIAENVMLGCAGDALLSVLVDEGFSTGDAQREIYAAERSPYVKAARNLLRKQHAMVGSWTSDSSTKPAAHDQVGQ